MREVLDALKKYTEVLGVTHRKGLITNGEYILAIAAVQVAEHALNAVGNNCEALAALNTDNE